jgi:hypothetical protein
MLKSIASAASQLASSAASFFNPSNALSSQAPSPLTSRKLARMEGFVAPNPRSSDKVYCRDIMVGKLAIVDCNKATLPEKLELINEIAWFINNMPSHQPITIVSLGSGLLLVEDLLFKQLSAAHQSQVRFRIIDPDYMQGRPHYKDHSEAINDFGSSRNTEPFITSTDYLSRVVDGKRLADSDREQGPVFILSVNPPSELGELDPQMVSDCLLVKGSTYPPKMIDKANALLFEIMLPSEALLKAKNSVSPAHGKNVLNFDNMSMICYPDHKGELKFEAAPYHNAALFFNDIKDMILGKKGTAQKAGDLPLTSLYRAALSVARDFESQNNDEVRLKVSILSGYDRSVSELNEHFASSPNPAICASLENNQIEIKELNPTDEPGLEQGSSHGANAAAHDTSPQGLDPQSRVPRAHSDDIVVPADTQPQPRTVRQQRAHGAPPESERLAAGSQPVAHEDEEESRRWSLSTLAGMGAVGAVAVMNVLAQYQGRTEQAPDLLTPGDFSQLPTVIVPSYQRDPDCYPHCLAEGDNAGVARVLGKAFAYLQKTFGDVRGNPFTHSKFVDIEFADKPRLLLPEYLREARSKGEDPNEFGAVVDHQMVEHRPGAKPQLVPTELLARCPDAADICLQGQFMYQMLRKEVHIDMGWVPQSYGLDIDGKIDFDNAIIMAMQLRPGGKRPPYFLEQKGISPSHKKWAVTADGRPASLLQFARHLEARFGGASNLRKAKLGKGDDASQRWLKIFSNEGLLQILEGSVTRRPQVLTPAQSQS